MSESIVDNLISRLLVKTIPWEQNEFQLSEIEQLCVASRGILLKEPRLLELKAPINIAGNLHGQLNTLLSVFEHDGLPPQSNYLFLGNYAEFADRSGFCLETILLLLALKIKYPKNIFLLRGNYDGVMSQRILVDECEMDQFRLFHTVNDYLDCLPAAALIDDKILCTHGGLSPSLQNLYPTTATRRPMHIPHKKRSIHIPDLGLLHDLYRSGPSVAKKVHHIFGVMQVKEFLEKDDLHLICCDHQVGHGYKVLGEQRLVFICSGSSLMGSACRRVGSAYLYKYSDKGGAMMSVDANLFYSFHVLERKQFVGDYKFMAAITQPESSSGVSLTCGTTMNKYGDDSPLKKHAERMSKYRFGSSTSTTKYEISPRSTPATKYRSNSPEYKLSNSGNSIGETESESETGTNPSSFDFDPASLYRSKSPGVKRFLGARV